MLPNKRKLGDKDLGDEEGQKQSKNQEGRQDWETRLGDKMAAAEGSKPKQRRETDETLGPGRRKLRV